MVTISRGPLPKLMHYQSVKGISVPWHSSFGNNFNYDSMSFTADVLSPSGAA
jgi:predicted dithiol-disulfide oxidoreductase (DUF899 family)